MPPGESSDKFDVENYIMDQPITKTSLVIPIGNIELQGDLSIPQHAHSLVLFAHGSGSSRLSTRNRMVAEYLNNRGIGTLLFDLLTTVEDTIYSNRFNIDLLAQRLREVTLWVLRKEEYSFLHIGYFGASTGAAAALTAANELKQVNAVVSRGGRPDLAMQALPGIKAPTLLIVGSLDTDVIRMNSTAFQHLNCEKKMEIIPGATHLFEEKGTLEKVCVVAANWFEMHLQPLELIK